MNDGARFKIDSTTIARTSGDGVAISMPFVARGAAKINGRTWSYVRSQFFVLATERSILGAMGSHHHLPTDTLVNAAVAQSFVNARLTRELFPWTGKHLREACRALSHFAADVDTDILPMRIADHVYNVLPLNFALTSVADHERVVVGLIGEVLRIDGPRARLALQRMDDGVEPFGEIGGKEFVDRVTIDGGAT